jgi:hypothetical protein
MHILGGSFTTVGKFKWNWAGSADTTVIVSLRVCFLQRALSLGVSHSVHGALLALHALAS